MFVEIHIIQNFAPSCLNRDESNSPKHCYFGGVCRARISSQCIKRAMREKVFPKYLEKINLATRTLKAAELIEIELCSRKKPEAEAKIVSKNIMESLIKLDKNNKSRVLLFLGTDQILALVDLCETNWDTLKVKKINKKSEEYKELKKSSADALDGKKAADLALFGRMIAELPDKRVDAASQVAHAISTNQLKMDFDFFTALDEAPSEKKKQGAAFMDTTEFNSACYYRYSNIDVNQLLCNLGFDSELTIEVIKCFIKASIEAIPKAKQTSMAAQNPPSFIMIVVRDDNLWSLANAFATPIKNERGRLIGDSITALAKYWAQLKQTYGDSEIKKVALISHDGELSDLSSEQVGSVDELITSTINAVII